MRTVRNGTAHGNDTSTSMGATAYRRGLPSVDVHCIRSSRALLESVREEQLSQHQVGAVSDEGKRWISDSSEFCTSMHSCFV